MSDYKEIDYRREVEKILEEYTDEVINLHNMSVFGRETQLDRAALSATPGRVFPNTKLGQGATFPAEAGILGSQRATRRFPFEVTSRPGVKKGQLFTGSINFTADDSLSIAQALQADLRTVNARPLKEATEEVKKAMLFHSRRRYIFQSGGSGNWKPLATSTIRIKSAQAAAGYGTALPTWAVRQTDTLLNSMTSTRRWGTLNFRLYFKNVPRPKRPSGKNTIRSKTSEREIIPPRKFGPGNRRGKGKTPGERLAKYKKTLQNRKPKKSRVKGGIQLSNVGLAILQNRTRPLLPQYNEANILTPRLKTILERGVKQWLAQRKPSGEKAKTIPGFGRDVSGGGLTGPK